MASTDLTKEMWAFAQRYALHRDGPRAYCEAYGHTLDKQGFAWVQRRSRDLRKDDRIMAVIAELTGEAIRQSSSVMGLAELIAWHEAVIAADPAEFMEVRTGSCRWCHGFDHGYQFYPEEYAELVAAAEAARPHPLPMPDIQGGLDYRHFAPPHPDCPRCGGHGISWEVPKATGDLGPNERAAFAGTEVTRHGRKTLMVDKSASAKELARLRGLGGDTLTLKGSVGIAAALATVQAGDPHAAAAAYEEFVRAGIATPG